MQGGLGNQMFQYAIAKSIAKKNKDEFKLDNSMYFNKNNLTPRNYELDCFNIEQNIAVNEEIIKFAGKENFLFRLKRKLGLSAKRSSSYYGEKERTVFDRNVFTYDKNIYLEGFWQNEAYFKDIRDELLKDFTLKNSVSYEAQKYLNNMQNCTSVSLHVRRGDYLHFPEIGVLDMDYYKSAIEFITKKVSNPYFFILSDDIKWCEENFKFVTNKVFVTDTKTAIEDLEVMKNCKHNITANSSFSWWGAWLNDNKEKIVISPKKWMANNPNNYSWVPNDWIKL